MNRRELVRRYLELAERGATRDALASVLHPEFRETVYPNRLVPDGLRRGFDGTAAAITKLGERFSERTWQITVEREAGELYFVEATRTAIAAKDLGPVGRGATVKSWLCLVFEFRDDRIAALRTYECIEPTP